MVSVVISIGSNCGDRRTKVKTAIEWLSTILIQIKKSDIYETPCALKTGKPYMNSVIEGYFQGTGIELEELLKTKEHEMGRTPECRAGGEVPIDMDIVICDREILKPWDYRQKFFLIGYTSIH